MLVCIPTIVGSEQVLSPPDGPYTARPTGGQAMSCQTILRTVEFKLYPNKTQAATLEAWLRRCCWLYNRALEQRTKAYRRRRESLSKYDQQVWLTSLRARIPWLAEVPAWFARSALERLDRAYKAFFSRCQAGDKPGYPRFKSADRYRSMEFGERRVFVRNRSIFVPGIGPIRARGNFVISGEQRTMRIIRRATGWYASITLKTSKEIPQHLSFAECGIDVGIESFATLDNGEAIQNPRVFRKAEKKMRAAHRHFSKCQYGSNRREKAKRRLARLHEQVQRQRRGFCHRASRDLVNRFNCIAIESLRIKSLARTRLAKLVNDAAWGFFIYCLIYKAANAGGSVVRVDSRGTSQTCPACGAVARKELSERTHCCKGCGFRCHRDHAAAMVIRQRAFGSVRGAIVGPVASEQAEAMKREVQQLLLRSPRTPSTVEL